MERDSKSRITPPPSRASAFDLQQLRYAIAAADHGSFRGAAEALRVRPSTLSRCVRQLEDSVGMTVFERSSAGVRVTPGGRDFLRVARSILDQMETLVTIALSTGRGEAGHLAIGFYTSLSAGNLRATLIEYAQRFPQIVIGMIESSRMRLVTALRNGSIDLAIVTGETPLLDNKSMPLWSERVLITLPKEHRLVGSEAIYWTDLSSETLLLSRRDPGPEIQDLLVAKLASPEVRPKLLCFDVSRESIMGLVGAGFGIGLTTEASLGADFAGLTYREARDGTGPSRIGYSAHWRADNDNPALANFLKLLGERYSLPVDRV